MAIFFTCAKFSLGATFPGHPRQRGVAPAESMVTAAGLHWLGLTQQLH